MKLGYFGRAMAPGYGVGDTMLFADDNEAARLLAEGVLSRCEDYPPRTESGVPAVAAKPPAPLFHRQSYQTKKGGRR